MELELEADLCQLLVGMSLGKPERPECTRVDVPSPLLKEADSSMECEAPVCHLAGALVYSGPDPPSEPAYQGCAYLQSIQSQLDSFPTTGGEYIESIFTHRQIFFAFPGGHRCCARAFSDIACSLQHREWRADREADMEAVNAFHYEAEFITSVVS
ncbi:hypothetical protein B0H15DRAFT_552165 [Mycena belliarum]|uniref:Uncharacterized protein n=1 Tax=Mycena belliarum TaxID=1033014 RepID=A0AAD6UDN5_9AGAR|nr:hypothetical protein B0H15DRAFT_552165 [Mycena belliae]